MISEHRFNCDWYGAPAGIVRDPALFALPEAQLQQALAPWAWVEFRGSADAVDRRAMTRLGFFLADTQVHFRLGLKALQPTPSLQGLTLRWADERRFEVNSAAMSAFHHERYRHLPGVTPERLNERYARWARQLIETSPATCVQVESGGEPQGWFLAAPEGKKLSLTLAVTAAQARISGFHLYLAAGVAFASRGFGIGEAAFSAHNTAVLNIYAQLGARFVSTQDVWLWVR